MMPQLNDPVMTPLGPGVFIAYVGTGDRVQVSIWRSMQDVSLEELLRRFHGLTALDQDTKEFAEMVAECRKAKICINPIFQVSEVQLLKEAMPC